MASKKINLQCTILSVIYNIENNIFIIEVINEKSRKFKFSVSAEDFGINKKIMEKYSVEEIKKITDNFCEQMTGKEKNITLNIEEFEKQEKKMNNDNATTISSSPIDEANIYDEKYSQINNYPIFETNNYILNEELKKEGKKESES